MLHQDQLDSGAAALASEKVWLTPLIVRSTQFKTIDGGWSAVLAAYLKMHLLGLEGGLSTVGVAVTLMGKPVKIFGTLKQLLSDGDGLRMALEWGGQGCMKPCFRHGNIMKKNSNRACHVDGYHEMTCVDPKAFKILSAVELHKAIDVLLLARAKAAALEIPKVRYNEMVMAFGFHPTPNGLLADRELRATVPVVQAFRYDWVHTFLSDGLVTCAAWALVKKACELELATQNDLNIFLSLPWKFSKRREHHGRQLKRIFDEYGSAANAKADTIKSSSSEMLSLYSLLRHWAATCLPTGDPRLAEDLTLFDMSADCLDTILRVKRGLLSVSDGGATLQRQLVRYGERHMGHHGQNMWRPKHHWAFDCAEQMQGAAFLFDAFVVERAHLRVKGVADRQQDTTHFEASVLSGVINSHINSFSESGVDGLQGRQCASDELGGATVADALDWCGKRFNISDVVRHAAGGFGEVVACAQEGSACFLVVDVYSVVDSPCERSSLCRASGVRRVWHVADVSECTCWRAVDDTSRLVVRQ